ncbi:hypothetical protein HPP92_003356 [Vanilla planifolia]|uniref:Uncharacterized protein n=1 Tax=Vanilla planifolia TaxID=51239 RepID=A0A835S2X7_VANPL|nr:hypothetical protein HPP92_003727 [Vanilla planifolia]KAG0503284.1 hypothetical protein HPP92_003356 [Vanilla planifolia]
MDGKRARVEKLALGKMTRRGDDCCTRRRKHGREEAHQRARLAPADSSSGNGELGEGMDNERR